LALISVSLALSQTPVYCETMDMGLVKVGLLPTAPSAYPWRMGQAGLTWVASSTDGLFPTC